MKSVDANIRRGHESLTKALMEKTSVHRAMYRNGLGWVDFVWGSEGRVTPSGKTRGAMGLSHLLEARRRVDGSSQTQAISLAQRLVEAIARGTELRRLTRPPAVNVTIGHGDIEVVLVKREGSNAWVLSGWKLKPGATGARYGATSATQSGSTPTQTVPGAGFDPTIPPTEEPRYSRPHRWADGLAPEVKSMAEKIGAEPKPWTERLAAMKDSLPTRLRQGTIDRFARLLDNDIARFGRDAVDTDTALSAWVASKMSKSPDGALEGAFLHGRLKWEDGALNVQETKRGLSKALEPIASAGELNRFWQWIIAHRSSLLAGGGTFRTGTMLEGFAGCEHRPHPTRNARRAAIRPPVFFKNFLNLSRSPAIPAWRRPAAPYLPGIPGMRHRQWRYKTPCHRYCISGSPRWCRHRRPG